MTEGIKKLLENVVIVDEPLLNLVSPLIQKCEAVSNGDEKLFAKCLKEASYSMLYIVENYELPPGLRPVSAEHSLYGENKFEYIIMKL